MLSRMTIIVFLTFICDKILKLNTYFTYSSSVAVSPPSLFLGVGTLSSSDETNDVDAHTTECQSQTETCGSSQHASTDGALSPSG